MLSIVAISGSGVQHPDMTDRIAQLGKGEIMKNAPRMKL
jgi:hypothetical protein